MPKRTNTHVKHLTNKGAAEDYEERCHTCLGDGEGSPITTAQAADPQQACQQDDQGHDNPRGTAPGQRHDPFPDPRVQSDGPWDNEISEPDSTDESADYDGNAELK